MLASIDNILSNLDCSRSLSAHILFQTRSAKMLQFLKYHCFHSYNGMYFSCLRESLIRWYRRDRTWSLNLNVTLENGIYYEIGMSFIWRQVIKALLNVSGKLLITYSCFALLDVFLQDILSCTQRQHHPRMLFWRGERGSGYEKWQLSFWMTPVELQRINDFANEYDCI